MKQTNNAIKFLMAQYRAIFKKAYLSGVASAVVLTAGLAAGAANAAVGDHILDGADFKNDFSNNTGATESITIDSTIDLGDRTDWGTQFKDNIAYASAQTTTINGAKVSIKGANLDGGARHLAFGGLTLTNGATLEISNSANTDSTIKGYTSGSAASGNAGVFSAKDSSVGITRSSINFNTVKLDNAKVEIGGKVYSNQSEVPDWYMSSNLSSVASSTGVGGTFDILDSTITLNDQSAINALGVMNISGTSTITFNGSLHKSGGYATAFIRGNHENTDVLGTVEFKATTNPSGNVGVPTIAVSDNSYGGIYANKTKFTNANFNIGKNATLILEGDWTNVKLSNKANEDKRYGARLTFTDVTSTNEGTIILGNSTDTTAGYNTSLVNGKTTLLGNLVNYTDITLGDSSNSATLTIDEKNIDLNKNKDSQGKQVTGMFVNGASILITSGSTLALKNTDSDGLDLLKDVNIVSGNATTLTDGAINIDGTSGGTIQGEHLVLTKTLGLDPTNTKLLLEGNKLEIGTNTATESSISAFGLSGLTGFDEVHFNTSGDTFTVDKQFTLTRDFYERDANGDFTSVVKDPGEIKGDNLIVTSGGSLEITNGAWITGNDQSLSIGLNTDNSSGTLTVKATRSSDNNDHNQQGSGNWTYDRNANPASLTLTGDFKIDGKDESSATVMVKGESGADALLDLRQAKSVHWGSGSVTLSGSVKQTSYSDPTASAGQGILYLTSSQFDNYIRGDLNNSQITINTKINLQSGGVLEVDGGISGPINVDEFTNIDSSTMTNMSAGKLNFEKGSNAGGLLLVHGSLSLVTGVDANGKPSNTNVNHLDIGAGEIAAESITINNLNPDITTDPTKDKVDIKSGTLSVSAGLYSNNKQIIFGDTTNSANLILDTLDNEAVGAVTSDLRFNSGSSLDVDQGSWSVKNVTLDQASLSVDNEYGWFTGAKGSLTGANLLIENAHSSNDVEVAANNSITFDTVQVSGAGAGFTVYGTLTFNGRDDIDDSATSKELQSVIDTKATAGIDLTDANITVSGPNAHLIFEEKAAHALVNIDWDQATAGNLVDVKDELANANITLSNFAELKLNFNGGKLTAEEALELKNKLVDQGLSGYDTGYLNIGNADLDFEFDGTKEDGRQYVAWEKIAPFSNVLSQGVTTDALKSALVTGVEFKHEVAGHYGALETANTWTSNNKDHVRIVGNLGLHNAYNGKFISTLDGKAVGAHLYGASNLQLEGAGEIGSITADTTNDNKLVFSQSEINAGKAIVSGDIVGVSDIEVANDVDVTGSISKVGYASITNNLNVSGDMQVKELDVWNGGSLSTNNLTIDHASSNLANGKVAVKEVLTLGAANTTQSPTTLFVADGEVSAKHIVVNNNSSIHVGLEADSFKDDPETDFVESDSHSGKLQTDILSLNKGSLVIDPDFSLETAVASVNRFDVTLKPEAITAGTVNGSIFVGQNSALGIGTDNLAELSEVLSDYQSNGKLVDFGSVLAVGKQFSLGSGDSLVLTADSIKDFNTYIDGQIKSGSKLALGTQGTDHTKLADTIFLGDNTALVVAPDALHQIGATGAQTALISAPNATVVADGGEIIIDGDVRAKEYKVFDAAAIKYIDGNEYRPVDATTGEITINEDKDILVSTENNFLVGYVENTGTVALGINPNGRAIMSRASNPVYEALESYAKGYVGDSLAADGSNALKGYDNKDHLVAGYHNNYFLQQTISTGDGSAAETVARLGVYGGAAQVALAAGNTTSEAISGRMGMGMNTALTQANNGQGAGMWVSPIYRSHSSDSLGAQGVNYGVDVDIYGVALGGDFTMANGLRVGAMFNIGSGSADGKDAGANVSNDFNYYGFGAYVGYTMNQFSVMGDISYTVADNDVDSNTSIEKVNTSLDSTNLSFGVTGQYTLSLGNDLTVVPHAGLRFSKIDLDNYTVKGSADVAHFSAESLNVFSVPVGVTLAKDYVGEEWTVKPSLDITLTGNFGDDSLDGDVKWTGVENLVTKTSSEVLDSFTYGATAGFSAKNGNFSMGLGVSYTGSSNTDEFGLNANARFLF